MSYLVYLQQLIQQLQVQDQEAEAGRRKIHQAFLVARGAIKNTLVKQAQRQHTFEMQLQQGGAMETPKTTKGKSYTEEDEARCKYKGQTCVYGTRLGLVSNGCKFIGKKQLQVQ